MQHKPAAVATAPSGEAATLEREDILEREEQVRVGATEVRLAGQERDPASHALFEAYICGEISAKEMITRFLALPQN
ncbi:hypothetical protein [Beijerinckia indica]|uniref:Antitoxin VbhA domain-containing protein n=1 Tax=Beijerinckia indica subsp. indica (strain ATCC 9039 / DSM 1715 / NCIMB 8712) TaxID=395963 RepID=B2IE14_BEII9|nr:hypothetical protein [Beijerinckia indica]ACB94038.1 hypothetical protein Bind_0385 [Beijerinckia indica subsp. indica ATCC 9039]